MPSGETRDETDFGFATVARREKASHVRRVFDAVASRYDVMNDLMSGGVHRIWKRQMMDWLGPRPGTALLDVAGGTGDIARLYLARAAREGAVPARALVCDINARMLAAGHARGSDEAISWVCGDAERLPLPDRAFDAYTIAFGIRNVTNMDAALAEARRVLKPGGRFLCLEFGAAAVPGLDWLYDAYSFNVIPKLGGLVAGEEEAYRYLVESIRRFPPQKAFAARVKAAGLGLVKQRNLSGGIAALTSAWRVD